MLTVRLVDYATHEAAYTEQVDLLRIADAIERELAERYVELPLDADGEVIHVSDKLDGYGKTITAVEMRYGRSGWVLISEYGNAYADCFAFTHHHKPTLEDVLRDLVTQSLCIADDVGMDELVRRFEPRVREVVE